MGTFTSLGDGLTDPLVARVKTLLPAVPIKFRGPQESTADYILIEESDERYGRTISDKDGAGNDAVVVLQFWGSKSRTLARHAKTIIDSLESSPLSVTGFYHIRQEVEYNQGLPALTVEGQPQQFSRRLQIRFFYHPNPA